MKEIIESILLNTDVRENQSSLETITLTEGFSPWQLA